MSLVPTDASLYSEDDMLCSTGVGELYATVSPFDTAAEVDAMCQPQSGGSLALDRGVMGSCANCNDPAKGCQRCSGCYIYFYCR